MVSAAKFTKEAPREPLLSLDACVRDFEWRFKNRMLTDQVVAWTASAESFREAAARACASRAENGKMHNHQSRVKRADRLTLYRSIMATKQPLLRSMARVQRAGNVAYTPFDALHDHVEGLAKRGIGPVTVYDVSVRLGAFLGEEPEQLYMHAGVRQGLQALWGKHPITRLPRVPRPLWPLALQPLKADDVEDILCTYREVFPDPGFLIPLPAEPIPEEWPYA